MRRAICAIDTGGTFTDCVVLDDGGLVTQAKASSTPDDLARGGFDALTRAAAERDLTVEELLGSVTHIVVGSTIGTNALLEHRGARVGMLCTRGHADVVQIMRGHGRTVGRPISEALALYKTDKPEAIVPRTRVLEVDERVDCFGEVVVPLDGDQIAAATVELAARGAEAIAVCFLWSHLNPTQEQTAKKIVAAASPELFVCTSNEVSATWGEYERWTAALINAALGPLTASYIDGLEQRLADHEYKGQLLLMTCNGGAIPVEEAKRLPVMLLDSGPVGGISGTAFLARDLAHDNVIATDLGGTSFDVGLVHGSDPVRSKKKTVGQYEFTVPHVDVRSIGSGGGSIAWVDASGNLHVGPHSAGADPGPACYGRGGTDATLTDAHVVLGTLNPNFFLGGSMPLDRDASLAVVGQLATQLGMDPIATAAGIVRITDANMADLLRRVTIEKGFHPQDFVLYSYGGAGGLHAASFGRELGIGKVVVPLSNAASVWSAFGIASSDIVHILQTAEILYSPIPADVVARNIDALERSATARLTAEGVDPTDIRLRRFAALRYGLQVHELTVPLDDGPISDATVEEAIKRFEQAYEDRYGRGSGFAEAGFELVAVSVEATGLRWKPTLARIDQQPAAEATTDLQRRVYWRASEDFVATPIYRSVHLRDGGTVTGPAIVELPTTTVALHSDDLCWQDPLGNLVVEVGHER